MSKPASAPYDRVSPQMLLDLSISQYIVTRSTVLFAAMGLVLLILSPALLFLQYPLALAVALVVIAEIVVYAILPRDRLVSILQANLDLSRQVPSLVEEEPPTRDLVQLASNIDAGSWVCLKQDYKRYGVQFRKENGRLAGDPKIGLRLVVALVKDAGNQLVVGFGDGKVEVWAPGAHVYEMDGPVGRERTTSSEALCIQFEELLLQLARTPMSRDELLLAVQEDFNELDTVLRALEKWQFVRRYDGTLYQITDLGHLWLRATPEGYVTRRQEKLSRKPLRDGGRTVMNNNFYGPSNYVQGVNLGPMNASQTSDIDQVRLISAIREVLQDSAIPWSRNELIPVRSELTEAAEANDPGKARQAFLRLRQVLDQLAIGVTGNAAFALLAAYYSSSH
jgi:hypothetical protein